MSGVLISIGWFVVGLAVLFCVSVIIGWLLFANEMGKPRPDPTLIDRIQRLFGDRK